jgi:hypothetical protein
MFSGEIYISFQICKAQFETPSITVTYPKQGVEFVGAPMLRIAPSLVSIQLTNTE